MNAIQAAWDDFFKETRLFLSPSLAAMTATLAVMHPDATIFENWSSTQPDAAAIDIAAIGAMLGRDAERLAALAE